MKEQEEAKERLKLQKEKLQSKKTAKMNLEEAEKKARLLRAKKTEIICNGCKSESEEEEELR